jgi:hypothetical protein
MRRITGFLFCLVTLLGIGMASVHVAFGQQRRSSQFVDSLTRPGSPKKTTESSKVVAQSVPPLRPNDPNYEDTWGALVGNFEQLLGEQRVLQPTQKVYGVILDDGVADHIDLDGNRAKQYDFNFTSDPVPTGTSHGTAVDSVTGAVTNNAKGVPGVAGLSSDAIGLISGKIIGSNGFVDPNAFDQAVVRILALKASGVNIKAVNLAFGGLGRDQQEADGVARLTSNGILVVAALANASTPDACDVYPACLNKENPFVIAISPLNAAGDGLSSNGRGDIGAPGVNVAVVSPLDPVNGAGRFSGGSAAVGHVFGELLLVMAYHASDPATARARVLFTAANHPLAGLVFGKMNAYEAFVSNAQPATPPTIQAVLDSVNNMVSPFSVMTTYNTGPTLNAGRIQTQTRIALFVTDLALQPGETASAITVTAISADGNVYILSPVENVQSLPEPHSFISRVTVPLMNDSTVRGDIKLRVIVHGDVSSPYTITIR